jgi:Phage portal protein, lambda family.
MNDPNAIAILNTKVTNAVGTGLVPQSQPDYVVLGWDEDTAAEWAQMVEREFALWAESTDCDSARAMDFTGCKI